MTIPTLVRKTPPPCGDEGEDEDGAASPAFPEPVPKQSSLVSEVKKRLESQRTQRVAKKAMPKKANAKKAKTNQKTSVQHSHTGKSAEFDKDQTPPVDFADSDSTVYEY